MVPCCGAALQATHLVVGASGVLDMPPFAPAEDATGPQDDTNAEGVNLGGSRAPSPAAAAAVAGSAADAGGGAEGGQKRVSYDFRRAGLWRQYWGTLQVCIAGLWSLSILFRARCYMLLTPSDDVA
jgi:hypothetical protein